MPLCSCLSRGQCHCRCSVSVVIHQKPSVGEYHIHKLRQKPPKSSVAGVGVAGSVEDLPTAYTSPTQSSLMAGDSDTDSPGTRKPIPPPPQQPELPLNQQRAELMGGKMSTDSDPLSDDSTTLPSSMGKKTVAINTSQVEHFTHRLLPAQSPEFDNVIDQVSLQVVWWELGHFGFTLRNISCYEAHFVSCAVYK